jgi:O-antigen ligase
VVALAPLPFGSNDHGVVAVWCGALGVAAVLATPAIGKAEAALIVAIVAVAAIVGWVVVEQSQPGTWLAHVSPAPIWSEASALLKVDIAPSAAVAVNQPVLSVGPFIADILALTVAFVLCSQRAVAERLLRLVAWCGAAYAVYGVLAFAIEPGMVLWFEKTDYASVLTSTFINRNTASLYFGLCSILWLLLACRRVRHDCAGRPMTAARLRDLLLARPSRKLVIDATMALLTADAMFMTGSRGGALVSLAAMGLAFLCYFRSEFVGAKRWLAATGAVAAIAFLLFGIIGEGVSARFDLRGISDEGRLDIYRATLAIVRDHPWSGAGLGTFAWVVPAYRPANISIWGTWDRAHSTPLEMISDLGVPTAALVFLGWAAIFVVLTRGVARSRSDAIFPIAGLCVAVAAVLHSAIDFSLQTPGFAIPAMSLIGMGLARSLVRAKRTRDRAPVAAGAAHPSQSAVTLKTEHDRCDGRQYEQRSISFRCRVASSEPRGKFQESSVMTKIFALPLRAGTVAGLVALLMAFAVGPSSASCFAPDHAPKATVADLEAWLAKLLKSGGETDASATISTVRDLAASDPGALSFILDKLGAASDSQRSAIGTGLGQAATICQRSDLPYATDIQTQLLAADKTINNQSAEVAFALTTGQQPIGATGAGGGGGGFSSGASGGQTAAYVSPGLSGTTTLQGLGTYSTKSPINTFTLNGNGSTSYTSSIVQSVSTP